MATLSIVQGFLAAGKTTFSRSLAAQTHAVRLNADETCEHVFPEDMLKNDWDACYGKAITMLWQRAEEHLKQGHDVILDFGFWDKASREYARNVAQRLNVEFKHYYLDTPLEEMQRRIALRKGFVAESNLRKFAELQKQFVPPAEDEFNVEVIIPR